MVAGPLVLDFPFTGLWVARNSPADRVPSHGTTAFGSSHAIDFVAVDERGRSAPRGWGSWFGVEPPGRFHGFGLPLVAPLSGTVVAAEDGEPDHVARRSVVAGLPYLLTQRSRVNEGARAIAGNHVVIAADPRGPFVLLAHLRCGSVLVRPGDHVEAGSEVGACGNSGNSTEPHVHVQASDSLEWAWARGVPIAFARGGTPWLPHAGEVFAAS